MVGADVSDKAVVEAAIKASEALPSRSQGGGVGDQGEQAAAASGAHLSRLLDLLAALKAVPQPSPVHVAAKVRLLQAWRDHYRAHAHLHAHAAMASPSGGRVGYIAVLCEGLSDFMDAHIAVPATGSASPPRKPVAASGIGAILAASSSLDMAVDSPFPALQADRGERGERDAGAHMQTEGADEQPPSLAFSPGLTLRASPAQDGETLTQPQTPMACRVEEGSMHVDLGEGEDGGRAQSSLKALRDMPLPSPLPVRADPPPESPKDQLWLACPSLQVHAGVVQPLLELLSLLLAEPARPAGPGRQDEDEAWEDRFAYALSVGASVAGMLLRPRSVRPAAPAPPSAFLAVTSPAPAPAESVPGPHASFGSQLVMGALLFELLSRLQPWARGCPAKTWAGPEASLDAVRQARFLLLAAVARLDAQAVQATFSAVNGGSSGSGCGGGGAGGEDAVLAALYPVNHRSPQAVTLPVAAAPPGDDDDPADAMTVEATRNSSSDGGGGASGGVWLSNLASAVVCAHMAHCLLAGPARGTPEPAAGPVLRPVALVALLVSPKPLCSRPHALSSLSKSDPCPPPLFRLRSAATTASRAVAVSHPRSICTPCWRFLRGTSSRETCRPSRPSLRASCSTASTWPGEQSQDQGSLP